MNVIDMYQKNYLLLHDASATCCLENLKDMLGVPATERNDAWVRDVEQETVHLSSAVWRNGPAVEKVYELIEIFDEAFDAIEALGIAGKKDYIDCMLHMKMRCNDLKSYTVGGQPMEPEFAMKVAGSSRESKANLLLCYS